MAIWAAIVATIGNLVAVAGVLVAVYSTNQQADQFETTKQRQRIAECQIAISQLRAAIHLVQAEVNHLEATGIAGLPGGVGRAHSTQNAWLKLYAVDTRVGYQCSQVDGLNIAKRPVLPTITTETSDRLLNSYYIGVDAWAPAVLDRLEAQDAALRP